MRIPQAAAPVDVTSTGSERHSDLVKRQLDGKTPLQILVNGLETDGEAGNHRQRKVLDTEFPVIITY